MFFFARTRLLPSVKIMSRIRNATLSDCPFVSDCARRAYAVYVDRIGKEPAPMVANFERHIRDGEVSVIEMEDGTPCGYVVFRTNGDAMLLENVAVDPAFHGHGLGRQLVDHVESSARDRDIRTVRLYTNVHMRENLSLYPALGYRETDRRREDGFDRVYFEKTLT